MDQYLLEFKLGTDKFREQAQEIINSGKAIETSFSQAADSITSDLKSALTAIAKQSKEINLDTLEQDIDGVINDSSKLKALFEELSKSASKMKDGSSEYKALQSIMSGVSAQIKKLDAETKSFADTTTKAARSIKSEYRAAQQEVAMLSEKFGATSKQAIEAAKRAAQLKDTIGDAADLTNAFNPDAKFNALTKSVSGVVSGFQAYQGAIALIGTENEDLQRTLVKLNALMALSSGLQALGEAQDSFKQLQAVAVAAFTQIRNAIGLTGIGALALALGALVVYWDDINEAVSGVSDKQRELADIAKKDLEIQDEKIKALDDQDNILKLQGKSEREILSINLERLILINKQKAADLKRISETEIAEIQSISHRQKFLEKYLGVYGTMISSIFGGSFTKNQDKEIQASKDKLNKALKDMENEEAGMKLRINELDKKANEEAIKNKKAKSDAQIKLEKEISDANQKYFEERSKYQGKTETRDQFESKLRQEQKDRDITASLQAELQKRKQDELDINGDLSQEIEKQHESRNKAINDNTIASLKKTLEDTKQIWDEVGAHAQSVLQSLGLNPQIFSAFKNAADVFDNKLSSDIDKRIAGVTALQTAMVGISDFIRNNEKQEAERKMEEINVQQEEELRLAGDNEQKKEIIRQKYELKRREIKRKEAEADKRKALFDAVINGAAAVIKALPNPFAVALSIAMTAAQIATIAATPIPKFAKGVHKFQGKGTGTSDSNLAYISHGESIIPAATTLRHDGLVKSLVDGDPMKYIDSNIVLPKLKEEEARLNEKARIHTEITTARIISGAIEKSNQSRNNNSDINTGKILKTINKSKVWN